MVPFDGSGPSGAEDAARRPGNLMRAIATTQNEHSRLLTRLEDKVVGLDRKVSKLEADVAETKVDGGVVSRLYVIRMGVRRGRGAPPIQRRRRPWLARDVLTVSRNADHLDLVRPEDAGRMRHRDLGRRRGELGDGI
jgi:hypothetical protein